MISFKKNTWGCFGRAIVVYVGCLRFELINPIKIYSVWRNVDGRWTKDAWKSAFNYNVRWATKADWEKTICKFSKFNKPYGTLIQELKIFKQIKGENNE